MVLLNKLGSMSDLRGLCEMGWASIDGSPCTPVVARLWVVTIGVQNLKLLTYNTTFNVC